MRAESGPGSGCHLGGLLNRPPCAARRFTSDLGAAPQHQPLAGLTSRLCGVGGGFRVWHMLREDQPARTGSVAGRSCHGVVDWSPQAAQQIEAEGQAPSE